MAQEFCGSVDGRGGWESRPEAVVVNASVGPKPLALKKKQICCLYIAIKGLTMFSKCFSKYK